MVTEKLMFFKILLFFFFLFYFFNLHAADPNIDQWMDSQKTYKDLIDEGFEVKAYDSSTVKSETGYILMFFVTVLQKDKEIYECQEYQTVDNYLQTLDLSFVFRKLVQPYEYGVDT